MNRITLLFLLCSGLLFAEGDQKQGRGGDEFRKAAEQYEAKAQKYYEMSILTKKLADIKRQAATLADEGKWKEINWDEYHEVKKKIAALHSHGKEQHEGKRKEKWEQHKAHQEQRQDKRKEMHEKWKAKKEAHKSKE